MAKHRKQRVQSAQNSKSTQNKHRVQSAQNTKTTQSNQNNDQSMAKNIAKVIGCVCLMTFILFDDLWIGTLGCALAFVAYFVLQVFIEKSKEWYASGYLYAAIACAALAYMEYQYRIISNLIGL